MHFHLGTCLGVEWLGQWVHVCSFSVDIVGFLMIHLFSFTVFNKIRLAVCFFQDDILAVFGPLHF